jgi:hypothetical protein
VKLTSPQYNFVVILRFMVRVKDDRALVERLGRRVAELRMVVARRGVEFRAQ